MQRSCTQKVFVVVFLLFCLSFPGADPGGGSSGSGTPPPFGGPLNIIKREKTLRMCARKSRVLVLNSYPDPPPPPLSEILSSPLDFLG